MFTKNISPVDSLNKNNLIYRNIFSNIASVKEAYPNAKTTNGMEAIEICTLLWERVSNTCLISMATMFTAILAHVIFVRNSNFRTSQQYRKKSTNNYNVQANRLRQLILPVQKVVAMHLLMP